MPKKTEQMRMEIPKDKKELKVVVKLSYADEAALASGMARVGETNRSSYIRRLIHENKGVKK